MLNGWLAYNKSIQAAQIIYDQRYFRLWINSDVVFLNSPGTAGRDCESYMSPKSTLQAKQNPFAQLVFQVASSNNSSLTSARAEIAQSLGVSVPALKKWESGLSFPEVQRLIEISRKYSVSVDWLLNIPPLPEQKSGPVTANTLPLIRDDGGVIKKTDDVVFSSHFFETQGFNGDQDQNGCFFFEAPSDAMWPTIRKHEMVVVDCSINSIEENEIHLIGYNGRVTLRRIQHRLGVSAIIADNKNHYQEFVVPTERLKLVDCPEGCQRNKFAIGDSLAVSDIVPADSQNVIVIGCVIICIRRLT